MTAEAPGADRFRWRGRTWLLIGSGAVAAVAGVLATQPALLFLAIPLLLAPVAAALVGPHRAPQGTLEWSVEGSGPEIRLRGAVTFAPPTDANDIVAEVRAPVGVTPVGPPTVDRESDRLQFVFDGRIPRPLVSPIPPPALVWRDPAGLVDRAVTVAVPPLTLERYPPELVHLGAIRLERTIALPGEVPSRRTGESGEFYGIREATPDDPPRRINWSATARAGRFLANEYLVDRTGDLLLVLDARATTLGGRIDAELLSLSVAAASGIAESFLREKARVGLGIYGQFLDVVPLASGRTQRVRLRRALLGARVATDPGPPERCAVSLQRYFRPGVTTILFTSLADDDTGDVVPFVRRRGYPVVVLSPSPLALLPRPTHPLGAPDEELVARLARLLRRNRVARAWRDAPVVDWDDYWSLTGLVNLLRRPARHAVGGA